MADYRLGNEAKHNLIRIHQYGATKFGLAQADKYYETFFYYFEIIAQQPYSFESVDYLKKGYTRCICGKDSIFYKINGEIVEIMAIIGQQDLDNVL